MTENFWGCLIRSLRIEQGITQRQLAVRVGINRTTLRLVENGEWPASVDFLEVVLRHFGYELDAIDTNERTFSREEAARERAARRSKFTAARSKLAAERLLVIGIPLTTSR